MTWDKVDGNAMLAYYKRLTHMRGESEVLREGTLRTWEVGEDGLMPICARPSGRRCCARSTRPNGRFAG